jgi:UDP-N-acetylglucosamine--N-acetylmuramyl-(pentapeptide) pyrophosphoryl-undecaprenol N-acetylglucosamine transferase
MEQEFVARAAIPFQAITTGQLRGKNPLTALINSGKIISGIRQSHAIIAAFRPSVVFITGGYVSVPVAVAAWQRRVPVVIYLPDMTPGLAIRLLSKLAARVTVSFAGAASFFGGEAPVGKAVVTGYPVRQELLTAASDRNGARVQLAQLLNRPQLAGAGQKSGKLPLLLVWGGSQGSLSINQATWRALPALLPYAHIVHLVGRRDWPLAETEMRRWQEEGVLTEELAAHYHPVDYLHEGMSIALAAADLTVARAGASTLGEFPVAALPSILVPLPSAGGHQWPNAEQLAQHGAAMILPDAQLQAKLAESVLSLLNEPEKLAAMSAAAAQLACPQAAAHIANVLTTLPGSNLLPARAAES